MVNAPRRDFNRTSLGEIILNSTEKVSIDCFIEPKLLYVVAVLFCYLKDGKYLM